MVSRIHLPPGFDPDRMVRPLLRSEALAGLGLELEALPAFYTQRTSPPPGSLSGTLAGGWSLAQEQHFRQATIDGWQLEYPGDTPSMEEIQALQSIGGGEGYYGRGWGKRTSPVTGCTTSMEDSHNWGSVQAKCKPDKENCTCCEGSGYWYDSRPTSSGQQYYDWCYLKYVDDAHGAQGILKILRHMPEVMKALPTGDLDLIAWRMRQAGYFQGFTTDKRKAAEAYAKRLDDVAAYTAKMLGEQRYAYRKGGDENQGIPGTDGGGVAASLDELSPGEAVAAGAGLALGAGILGWTIKTAIEAWQARR